MSDFFCCICREVMSSQYFYYWRPLKVFFMHANCIVSNNYMAKWMGFFRKINDNLGVVI